MESFLIASKEKKDREKYILLFCQEKKINPIDIIIIEEEKTIGIANVRNLQKTLFLKPLKSKLKAVIINNAHTLTTEAQNALLKILEEPPPNTIIILSANDTNAFLPTILSRCKIIELKSPKNHSASDNSFSLPVGVGERLKLAESLAKNKDEAILWLEKMILSLRLEFIKNPSNPSLFMIHYSLFQKTYVTLKTTNTNTRLTLENLLLNI